MSDALEYCGGIARGLKELEDALVSGADVEVFDELYALDWQYTLGLDGELRSVTMVRTLGGPHCTVEFRLDGYAVVVTQWGKDLEAVVTSVPSLTDYVVDFVYGCIADAGLRASRN